VRVLVAQVVQFNFRNPLRVRETVAGTHEVKTNEIQKRMGLIAWDVFVCLIWHRNEEGITRIRNATIAEKTKHSIHKVKLALRRLKKLGIIEGLGYEPTRGKRGGSIPIRRVLGDFRERQVTFPTRVLAAVRRLPKHGGARTGAGRPKKLDPKTTRNQDAPLGEPSEKFKLPPQKAEIKSAPVENQIRSGLKSNPLRSKLDPTTQDVDNTGGIEDGLSPKRELREEEKIDSSYEESTSQQVARRPAPSDSVSPDSKTGSKGSEATPPSNVISLDDARRRKVEEIRRRAKKRARERAANPVWNEPPYPDSQRMGVERTKNPPPLEEGLSKKEMVEILVRVYRGAYESRYGAPSFVLAKVDVTKSNHYKLLKNAAQVMLDHDIAPASWIAWSMDVFRAAQKDKGRDPNRTQPSFSFVFSGKRLNEKRWWFREQMGGYLGGQPQPSPESRDVLRRWNLWNSNWRRLWRGVEKRGFTKEYGEPASFSSDDLDTYIHDMKKDLASQHFPGGWEKWYADAKEANRAYAQRLKRMMTEGKFVWNAE
jgi:hypothetical protein